MAQQHKVSAGRLRALFQADAHTFPAFWPGLVMLLRALAVSVSAENQLMMLLSDLHLHLGIFSSVSSAEALH